MKKILLISSIISSMLISQVVFAVPSFSDVTETTPYDDSITWMASNGVIQGYPDGTFAPDQCVNRAEFLKMLYLSSQKNINAINLEANNIFSDTSTDQWYWPYISQALTDETVEGYKDGTFKPGQCVNRVEAIKMALLEFNDGTIPTYETLIIMPEDISIVRNDSDWWLDYFVAAASLEIFGIDHFEKIDGSEYKYNFEPGEAMSRKEVAEMLYRLKAIYDNDIDFYRTQYSPNELNFYTSPSSGISFIMPDGWTVENDSYYYAYGYTNDYPTLQIVDTNGEKTLINMKMASCEDPSTPCYELNENYILKALAGSDIANSILLTFREPNWNTYVNNHIVSDYNLKFTYPTNWEIISEEEEFNMPTRINQLRVNLALKDNPAVTLSIYTPPLEIGYHGYETEQDGIEKDIPGLIALNATLLRSIETSRLIAHNTYQVFPLDWVSTIEIFYGADGQTFDQYGTDFHEILDSLEYGPTDEYFEKIEGIRDGFAAKYPENDFSEHEIMISMNYQDQYVSGGINFPEGGGAMFWATKVDGEWVIVFETQDAISCSAFDPYNFPEEMFAPCSE